MITSTEYFQNPDQSLVKKTVLYDDLKTQVIGGNTIGFIQEGAVPISEKTYNKLYEFSKTEYTTKVQMVTDDLVEKKKKAVAALEELGIDTELAETIVYK